jgi:hypothetical protein
VDTTQEALGLLDEFVAESRGRNENEAETRHKIIDLVLHDILSWPRNRVAVEEFIRPGYADYVLKKANGDHLLFVEAKRSGIFFSLPLAHARDETSCYVGIQRLLTDENIRDAMTQVRTYCVDTGCEFACITNGHEWVLFKTFEKGKRWEHLQAFVIRTYEFFRREYTKAVNSLSYIAITEQSSLVPLLTSAPPKDRTIYYAKDRIVSYGHSINANRLAGLLRPVVNQYFGVISDDDTEFMDRCYVSQRDYVQTFEGVRTIIQDRLTPYFEEFGVQQLEDTGRGGRLGGRLGRAYKANRKGEVLVLFGGKGAGKSTFIKRLLHHNVPPRLREHSIVAIIDLLTTPEERTAIHAAIWDGLVRALDRGELLSAERERLIEDLFADRFAIAARQELSGLAQASETYNTRLNSLVSEWKADKLYCARQLVSYWQNRGKGVIVVVDNTDQYSGPNQDFCFTSAQEIANQLGCITLISMREERFYNSKVHGVLDAFQNSGFHISSPKPAEVFRKRLNYTIAQLRKRARGAGTQDVSDGCRYLSILEGEFSNERSPLKSFLSACADGDTRVSLDLFRSFVQSGYTNVEEMLASGGWTFQIHQVIKPVMTPTRFFYDEKVSDIPNIYQLRFNRHGSHFTALRILRKLAKNVEGGVAGYLPIAQLKAYFAETFNMLDDFKSNVDILLKRGFVEANNRLDEYSESVDSLKVSSYGLYMLEQLAYLFSYIDLICIDCGVFDQEVSNYTSQAANEEYALFLRQERMDRVRVRLDRAEHFIRYLCDQERREREEYSLGVPDEELFTHKAVTTFEQEKTRVLASAARQASSRTR